MYLHEDKELFREVVAEVNAQTGVAQTIIEKDYYVTMILKLLSERLPEIVFKGGTSLSKCFHLIERSAASNIPLVWLNCVRQEKTIPKLTNSSTSYV